MPNGTLLLKAPKKRKEILNEQKDQISKPCQRALIEKGEKRLKEIIATS
jgi:hypothetical protein